MIYAINYANEKYRNAQKLNSKSAYIQGVQKVIEYGPKDLSDVFVLKNQGTLQCVRGNGYWLWKPYIIDRTLSQINEGDYLIYADSGTTYVNKVHFLIKALETSQTDIMLFQIKSLEKYYTKRDAFIIMQCDTDEYASSPQICATFMMIKKTDRSAQFIKEWLNYAQNEQLITDSENIMGSPNYEGFVDHRHDQSILSLLSKKYHIEPFRDASQYGNDMKYEDAVIKRSTYPQIFDSHRNSQITAFWIVYKFSLDKKWSNLLLAIRKWLSKIKRFILHKR